MNQEQEFLIKYGIHNFVSYQRLQNTPVFSIRKSVRHKMVSHAQKLIQGAFGELAEIKLI